MHAKLYTTGLTECVYRLQCQVLTQAVIAVFHLTGMVKTNHCCIHLKKTICLFNYSVQFRKITLI